MASAAALGAVGRGFESLYSDTFYLLMMFPLSWITWDPPRIAFTIPFIDRPVAWYGILFVIGFGLAYFLFRHFFKQKLISFNYPPAQANALSQSLGDKILWYAVIGTILGARLGEVFFYSWPHYRVHPLDIFKVWEGGLASHGGTVGVMFAVWLFYLSARKSVPQLTFVDLLDLLIVPTSFTICCIRLGNFVNQEIVGNPTEMPWGIIFGHPADGSMIVPRHPVQLYEAISYFSLFVILYFVRKRPIAINHPGFLSGCFFLGVFGSRFFLEIFKAPLETIIDQSYLEVGQLLSIPFIILGFSLLFLSFRKLKTS